jgi:hypothetical protein
LQQRSPLQHGALLRVCALVQAADADRHPATVRCPHRHRTRRTRTSRTQCWSVQRRVAMLCTVLRCMSDAFAPILMLSV